MVLVQFRAGGDIPGAFREILGHLAKGDERHVHPGAVTQGAAGVPAAGALHSVAAHLAEPKAWRRMAVPEWLQIIEFGEELVVEQVESDVALEFQAPLEVVGAGGALAAEAYHKITIELRH
mgnify:CR=1 FL=1